MTEESAILQLENDNFWMIEAAEYQRRLQWLKDFYMDWLERHGGHNGHMDCDGQEGDLQPGGGEAGSDQSGVAVAERGAEGGQSRDRPHQRP